MVLIIDAFLTTNERYDLTGDGLVNTTDVVFAINAFLLNWPPSNLAEGRNLTFYLKGTDPDLGQTLTYSATGLPQGACFNGKKSRGSAGTCPARQFTWTPTSTQSGNYKVTFTVSDGTLTNSATLPITVLNTQ